MDQGIQHNTRYSGCDRKKSTKQVWSLAQIPLYLLINSIFIFPPLEIPFLNPITWYFISLLYSVVILTEPYISKNVKANFHI